MTSLSSGEIQLQSAVKSEEEEKLNLRDICKQCDGMQIVATLNQMFGMFDVLSDKNNIYKVETVKDCFVGVAGAPEK